MSTTKKYVFAFEEGDGKNKKLLGGKGANLCEMTQIGLRVPPGFVISTEACLAYLDDSDRRLPGGVMDEVRAQMKGLEAKTGKSFGGRDNCLLVSVRSGSALSMPGMMDTILNLGLNAETLEGLIAQTGNERAAVDQRQDAGQIPEHAAVVAADGAVLPGGGGLGEIPVLVKQNGGQAEIPTEGPVAAVELAHVELQVGAPIKFIQFEIVSQIHMGWHNLCPA